MADINRLISLFSPIIYFCPNESCFPISIEQYLSCCEVKSSSDPTYTLSNPTNASLYQLYKDKVPNLNLTFSDPAWKEKLKGDSSNGPCYVRVIPWNDGGYIFVYFYLLSHTEPYKICNCFGSLDKFAHKADLKFIAVYVGRNPSGSYSASKVYYGAHGTRGGMWKYIDERVDISEQPRDSADITFEQTHPIVAYSCHGDHSFYPLPKTYFRIFGIAWDVCKQGIVHESVPIRIYSENEKEFDPSSMGWVYFNGKMNTDGIDSPANQWFWDAQFPSESNNWFRRLCCCSYF